MPRTKKKTVGDRIRELREGLGWSQHELAVESGLTVGTISRVEVGRAEPTRETVEQLARALQVQPGWLLFGE